MSVQESRLVRDLDEIDALPYVDNLYQGKMKADVDGLIRREMSTFEPENYLESFPTLSYTFPKLEPISMDQYSVCNAFSLHQKWEIEFI